MNVILIVVDTLRKDYAKPLEEDLKKIGFISYKNVFAPAPWTVPSHASIFTGSYPSLHKAHETKDKKGMEIILKNSNILSKDLQMLNYKTYLFTANPYIRPCLGYKGFHYFYEVNGRKPRILFLNYNDSIYISNLKKKLNNNMLELIKYLILNNLKIFIKAIISKLLSPINPFYYIIIAKIRKWPLDKGAKKFEKIFKNFKFSKEISYFIFTNLMEVHEPYFLGDKTIEVRRNIIGKRLDKNYVEKCKKMYIKQVKYVSQRIIKIMKIFIEKGIFNDSFIIITSDHGQLLGEHGKFGHVCFLHDELIKVPLLIKYPSNKNIEKIDTEELISLTRLKDIIKNVIQKDIVNDRILYSKTVFAESFGIGGITVKPKTIQEKLNVEQLEKYRIAVYHKNFKGIFNVTDWKFEEIKSYDSNIKITQKIKKDLKKEVIKFLKTATISKIPKKKF